MSVELLGNKNYEILCVVWDHIGHSQTKSSVRFLITARSVFFIENILVLSAVAKYPHFILTS